MSMYIDKRSLYSCGEMVDGHECGAKVTIHGHNADGDPVFVRECDHNGKIYANVAARCKGNGGMISNAEHFVKHTVVAKLLSRLLGRSVVWQ
jgi:hypothetical protein